MYLMLSAFLILSELPLNYLDIINKSMEHVIVSSPNQHAVEERIQVRPTQVSIMAATLPSL